MSKYQKPTAITGQNPLKSTPDICLKEGVVVLQPLAMTVPNRHGIYSPSKLEPKKEISYKIFLAQYADYPQKIRVCFDEAFSSEALLQKSEWVTAYGFGLDCWYMVVTSNAGKERNSF